MLMDIGALVCFVVVGGVLIAMLRYDYVSRSDNANTDITDKKPHGNDNQTRRKRT